MKFLYYFKTYGGLLIFLLFSQSVFAQLGYMGLKNKEIASLAITSPFSGQHILTAGTKGNGVFYTNLDVVSENPDSNWVNEGLNDKNILSVFILNNNIGPACYFTLFATVENDSLNKDGYLAWQKQLNCTGEWTAIDSTLRDSVNHIWGFARLACDECLNPASYLDLYCCTEKGIYKQNGSDWEKVLSQGGLGWISSDQRSHSLWTGGVSIAMTPLLFTLGNNSQDWRECKLNTAGIGDAFCYGVAVDPNFPDTVYAALDVYILKSEDDGVTWKKAGFSGEVWHSFIAIAVDPSNSEHIVAVSNSIISSLFESYDGGQSWKEIITPNLQSPMVDMVSATFNDSLWVVYIATVNDGVFSYYSSPVIAVKERNKHLPLGSGLGQNYPNPFNSSTLFSYTLPYADYVKISMFNVSGELVVVLHSGYKSAGLHKIAWRAWQRGFFRPLFLPGANF